MAVSLYSTRTARLYDFRFSVGLVQRMFMVLPRVWDLPAITLHAGSSYVIIVTDLLY
jgi:hypothetical protein